MLLVKGLRAVGSEGSPELPAMGEGSCAVLAV